LQRVYGTTDNIVVVKGLGYGLDESAVDAVSKWRYQPATRDGVPIDHIATIEIGFTIF